MKHCDPKLAKAMTEIKAVMDKYECGGFAVISSREATEYELHFPKWSAAQFDTVTEVVTTPGGGQHQGVGIRVKSKGAVGTEEHKRLESSVHLVMSVRDTCGLMAEQMHRVVMMLMRHMDIEHKNQMPGRN